METVHGEEGPGQSPQETQHSRGEGGGRAADRTQGRARGGLRRVKGRVCASKEGPLRRQPSSSPGATVWVQILSLQLISYVDFGPYNFPMCNLGLIYFSTKRKIKGMEGGLGHMFPRPPS